MLRNTMTDNRMSLKKSSSSRSIFGVVFLVLALDMQLRLY